MRSKMGPVSTQGFSKEISTLTDLTRTVESKLAKLSSNCYMMAGINLPLCPPVIAIVFLLIYAISVLKSAKIDFPSPKSQISPRGARNEQPSIKNISFRVQPSIQASTHSIEKESTFSKDWWCHDSVFQLERRAIFSRVLLGNSNAVTLADDATELDLCRAS